MSSADTLASYKEDKYTCVDVSVVCMSCEKLPKPIENEVIKGEGGPSGTTVEGLHRRWSRRVDVNKSPRKYTFTIVLFHENTGKERKT